MPTGNAGSKVLVAGLTALGERDAQVREAERRAGRALLAMTDDEGLSLRGAVDWCGNGVTVREMTRLRRMAQEDPGGNGLMNARHVSVGPQRRVVRT
ncbi:MAG: hypothetical protein ABW156_09335 [Jiangellaceae bacterium]